MKEDWRRQVGKMRQQRVAAVARYSRPIGQLQVATAAADAPAGSGCTVEFMLQKWRRFERRRQWCVLLVCWRLLLIFARNTQPRPPSCCRHSSLYALIISSLIWIRTDHLDCCDWAVVVSGRYVRSAERQWSHPAVACRHLRSGIPFIRRWYVKLLAYRGQTDNSGGWLKNNTNQWSL